MPSAVPACRDEVEARGLSLTEYLIYRFVRNTNSNVTKYSTEVQLTLYLILAAVCLFYHYDYRKIK
jgi:hypothetical protein